MNKVTIFMLFLLLPLLSCSKDNGTGDDNGNNDVNSSGKFVDIDTDGLVKYEGSSVKVAKALSEKPINITNVATWICFDDIYKETLLNSNILKYIKYNGKFAVNGENVEVLNYYGGTYIRPIPPTGYTPIYLNHSTVDKTIIEPNKVYINDEIPVGNNKITEFYMKRGYMVVFAENPDGTGESKVYMAIDHDCEFQLEPALSGKVSFMRVTPWNYITKRGTGGNKDNELAKLLGTQWFYNWGTGSGVSEVINDYVPMFAARWADNVTNVENVKGMKGVNHVLSFNEPDNADQSNITAEDAVARYEKLLSMGYRMGSPSCCEGVWRTWLSDFVDGCKANKYRVDFIGIHWYDWGDWCSTANKNPNVDQVVNRFINDIENCYKKYGLPIWITEFNANTNRATSVHTEFLKKVIPLLEANPHVERYAYFQPMSGEGHYFVEGTKSFTTAGRAYIETKSTPSVIDNNPIPKTKIDR